ncbi:MAG: ThuA domain-containing protein [Fimbriimonadaceae bacterium]
MGKRALIVHGGWDGHDPVGISELFGQMLVEEGFEVVKSDSLTTFDSEDLTSYDLLVPHWTMGKIEGTQSQSVCAAVREHGVGIAGAHGGMCDAFRDDTEWQFMTGGQFVAHPGNDGTPYKVNIVDPSHTIMTGASNFQVSSEQYYMHVDPGIHVLADCQFPNPVADGPHTENPCRMPTIWTKQYGKGRVFYNALGHQRNVLEAEPVKEIMRRGFLWATR